MAAEPGPSAKTVFLVSGSTGRTCDEVLRAALAQFDNPDVRVVRRAKLRSARRAQAIAREASEQRAIVFHSLVAPGVRQALVTACEHLRVPAIDVLGPALTVLEDHLQRRPRRRPGLSFHYQQERFHRIDAVDFTLAHDDGCGLADLDQADVVLVGASRVSKSVTCFYLAYRGVRAANVPLIPGHDPPAALLGLDSRKVIGLTMNIRRLASLRAVRAEMLGAVRLDAYVSEAEIARELRAANELIERHGWQKIDVSYTSVEEVASQILALLEDQQQGRE